MTAQSLASRSARALAWATTLLLLAFAAGCGQAAPPAEKKAEQPAPAPSPEPPKPSADTSKPPAQDSQPKPEEPKPAVVVTMRQGKYEPPEVKIKAGQAVQWWNNDTEVHGPLLVLRDGDPTQRVADNGGPFRPGERFTYVFKEPGKYLLQDRAASLDVEMTQWITVEP